MCYAMFGAKLRPGGRIVIVDARVPPTESPAAEAKIETTPQRYVLPKNLRTSWLDEDTIAPNQNGETERSGSLIDPGSGECGAVSVQSRHNAIANCPRVRDFTIGCEEGFGV